MSTTSSSSSIRKKRNSFSLSSFRKPAPPAPAAPPIRAEQAKARNAAAWQWLTRGIGDVVVPTKRPTPQQSLPPDHPKQLLASAAASPKDGGIVSTRQKETPIIPGLPRSPSRFKVEATAARSNGISTGKSAASPGTSSPLYDEFELSGLHAHMMDFVHRLQEKQKSNPQDAEAAEDKKVASTPVAPVAPSHGIHPSTPVSSALHKFFNKVNFISSIRKSSKKSAPAPKVLVMPDEAPPDDEVNDQEDVQYQYHHYIHHHHHHYHYGRRPDEVTAVLGHHRTHSESSEALRPYIPSLWKAEEGEDDDEVESPIKTFLDARCRRHSEDFLRSCYMQGKDQDSNKHADEFAMMGESVIKRKAQDSNNHADEFAMMGESVIKSSLQLPRKYNSARFTTPNKIQEPGHGNRTSKEGERAKEGRVGRQSGKSLQESIHMKTGEGKKSGNGGDYDSTSRTRRHSAEIVMEANHYTGTQRVPHGPPQRRHSETYNAGYRAFALEYASDGGRTKKAIRTPLPRLGHNYNSDMGSSRSERRPLHSAQYLDNVFTTTADNFPRRPPPYLK